MSRKHSKEDSKPTPLLVYICGHITSETKTQLIDKLSKQLFVKQNTDNMALFVDQCYDLMESWVFIFILDNHSIKDKYCLTLLGMSISLDIPIITIRNMGFIMPLSFPAYFSSTEIVNRKNKITVPTRDLETVTTLDKAMSVLFAKSLIYHQEISSKCTQEIFEIVSNAGLRSQHHFKHQNNEYTQGKISMKVNENYKGQKELHMHSNKLIDTNYVNNFKENNKGIIQKETNGTRDNKNNSHYLDIKSKSKLIKYKSSSFITTGNNTNKDEKRKTSLPEMRRNYLVSSKPGNTEVCPFPSSPSFFQNQINYEIHNEVLEEDEDKSICLSRACTPPDFLENDNDSDIDMI